MIRMKCKDEKITPFSFLRGLMAYNDLDFDRKTSRDVIVVRQIPVPIYEVSVNKARKKKINELFYNYQILSFSANKKN